MPNMQATESGDMSVREEPRTRERADGAVMIERLASDGRRFGGSYTAGDEAGRAAMERTIEAALARYEAQLAKP